LPKQNQPRLCIAYRILHPSLLNNTAPEQADSAQPAPLLVVHGGPSLPSEYLTPLANHIHNRSIIFYDQLGCGWSSIPRQKEWDGVTQMSHDLGELLQHLKDVWRIQSFHLLGHSLGGAIGYEYLKMQTTKNTDERRDVPCCLSFILSNASTNLALSSSEQRRLFQEFQLQQLQTSMPSFNNKQLQKKCGSIEDEFFHSHICRAMNKPAELELALSRRGMEWSANEYSATPLSLVQDPLPSIPTTDESVASANPMNRFPPVLLIRGQYDFVTEICTRGWFEIFTDGIQEVIVDDCAHYPHFEQPERYSYQIERFCGLAESSGGRE
jgi:pimeloyl-ACP methyl ester carboxylesterase